MLDKNLIKEAKEKWGITDDFEHVSGGWISHPPEVNAEGQKLVGQAHYVIVDGEDWIREFPSGVPPTRIKEALEVLSRSYHMEGIHE